MCYLVRICKAPHRELAGDAHRHIAPLVYLILGVCLWGCSTPSHKQQTGFASDSASWYIPIAETIFSKTDVTYQRMGGLWLKDGKPVTGLVTQLYPDGTLQEKFGVLNGKRQNEYYAFFPDGHPQFYITYLHGKRHGESKSWTNDSAHMLISHLHYKEGRMHGVQKKYYRTGELFKVRNMNMGKEQGLQQAYRQNGKLYTNYEARNGRIFGLKKSTLCFEVEDEQVVYNPDEQ